MSSVIQQTSYGLASESQPGLVQLPISARSIVGDTSGTAVPAGRMGEVITFTQRTTTGSSGDWVTNATPLATLTPGFWLIFGYASFPATSTASVVVGRISTNSTADSSGGLAHVTMAYTAVSGAANGFDLPMGLVAPVNISVNTPIYAKSFSEDAAVNVTLRGFAVRIA